MFFRPLKRLPFAFSLVLLCACIFFPCANAAGETSADESQCRIGSDTPSFENQIETQRFILRWTNASSHEADNINDPEIIRETAGYFEAAWDKLTGLFGRAPYLPPGSFQDRSHFSRS